MSSPRRALAALALLCVCAATVPASAHAQENLPEFWYRPELPLGRPALSQLVNTNGSPRVANPALYDVFWRDIAPKISAWSADPRVNLSPNFVAALITKESGFDPLATSAVPANGLTQMTHIADVDLQQVSRDAAVFQWMHEEVMSWPRHPLVHRENAAKQVTDSLLAAGQINAANEYLFDSVLATRAGMLWLRMLATVWLEDEWPGAHGRLARKKLNGGKPISQQQLLELVTVSYNQGYPYVRELVEKFGKNWTKHLNEESADYLERIRYYTTVYQAAARAPAG